MKTLKVLIPVCFVLVTVACNGQKTNASPDLATVTPTETIVSASTAEPEQIVAFVKQYFPKATISSCIKDGNEYEVILSDGTQLEFDRSCVWKEIDCSHATVYTAVPAGLVPAKISSHVASKFTGKNIVKLTRDGRKWDVELSSGLEIEFDSNFNVREVDVD